MWSFFILRKTKQKDISFLQVILNTSLPFPHAIEVFCAAGYWSVILCHVVVKVFFFSIISQAHEKVPSMEKTSVLRTLKDHLYQCPSKLSEEMVNCMAAVYCWLRSATSMNPGKNRSPLLSRSSTNVILPRRGIGEDKDWSCKSMVEISWLSTDKSQFSRASYAFNNYRWIPNA